jgi:1-phosphofructokinase
VGAGDSSLAGFLLADVAGCPDERVRSGIRYGSAAAAAGNTGPHPRLLPGDVPVRALASENPP